MKGVELYARVRFAVQIEGVSQREAARRFGIDPRTVAKMLTFSVPPGIGGGARRRIRSWTPLPGSSTGSWWRMRGGRESSGIPRSGSLSGYAMSTATLAGSPSSGTTFGGDVCSTARCLCRCSTIPVMRRWILAALAEIAGVERKIHFFAMDLPHSDACFVRAYPEETTEAFCDGHNAAF